MTFSVFHSKAQCVRDASLGVSIHGELTRGSAPRSMPQSRSREATRSYIYALKYTHIYAYQVFYI